MDSSSLFVPFTNRQIARMLFQTHIQFCESAIWLVDGDVIHDFKLYPRRTSCQLFELQINFTDAKHSPIVRSICFLFVFCRSFSVPQLFNHLHPFSKSYYILQSFADFFSKRLSIESLNAKYLHRQSSLAVILSDSGFYSDWFYECCKESLAATAVLQILQ